MFLLELRLKKEYSYTVLPFYAIMACYRVNFTFRGSVNPFSCLIRNNSLVHMLYDRKVPDTGVLLKRSVAQIPIL